MNTFILRVKRECQPGCLWALCHTGFWPKPCTQFAPAERQLIQIFCPGVATKLPACLYPSTTEGPAMQTSWTQHNFKSIGDLGMAGSWMLKMTTSDSLSGGRICEVWASSCPPDEDAASTRMHFRPAAQMRSSAARPERPAPVQGMS